MKPQQNNQCRFCARDGLLCSHPEKNEHTICNFTYDEDAEVKCESYAACA